jgi:glycosyltransferase involved in cell wall biosynthesis
LALNWPEACVAIIPCLNEAAHVGALVRAVRRFLPAVIVIDDASSDGTGKQAAEVGAEVLRLGPTPSGKGAALRRGWERAGERGFVWALCLDGDGQHAPGDIPLFFDCAAQTGADLVVGNRMAHPAGMPLVRRWTNQFMSWRLSRLAGQRWPDTQCGFRLMNLVALAQVNLRTCHFEIDSEMLLGFAEGSRKIAFVPIQVIYRDEASRIRPWRDAWRWFGWLRHRRAKFT